MVKWAHIVDPNFAAEILYFCWHFPSMMVIASHGLRRKPGAYTMAESYDSNCLGDLVL